jgi:hypothetical protein
MIIEIYVYLLLPIKWAVIKKKKDGKGGQALKGWKFVHNPISLEEWEALIFLSSM